MKILALNKKNNSKGDFTHLKKYNFKKGSVPWNKGKSGYFNKKKCKHNISRKIKCEECRIEVLDYNRKYHRIYRKRKGDTLKAYKSCWYQKNKPRLRRDRLQYLINREKKDIQFRLRNKLRGRLRNVIRYNFKKGACVKEVGCTGTFLRKWIKNQFTKGMSWDNWGQGHSYWNIDHIKPLISFDLTNQIQLAEACHFTNVRPLWFEDNLKRRNK